METATPAGLVFLVMINDLKLPSESFLTWKFADDTTISEIVPSSKQSHLQDAVDYINNWSQENGLQLNPTKCKEVVTCFKGSPPCHRQVELDGEEFERVSTVKVLGITISNDLKWNDHVGMIATKAAKRLYLLRQLKRAGIGSDDLVQFYCSVIRSVLEYACHVFHRRLPSYLMK